MLFMFSLMTACSGENPSAGSDPAQTDEGISQSNEDANETTGTDDMTEEAETPAAHETITLVFDPHAYQDPGDDDRLNALVYATNNSDNTAMATVRYRVYDIEGNVISAFDQFNSKYYEQFKEDIFIPAGAKDFPVAFSLPSGYKYDLSTGQDMPEVDHIEFELLETKETDLKDLRSHFESGEPEIRENHIYIYVKFDEEIGNSYTTLYPSYTLLGYSGDTVTTVCCKNDYPYGNSSYSVAYAKENNNSSILVYHHIPNEAVDKWGLFLGCVGGE